jgi:hypothetical protein
VPAAASEVSTSVEFDRQVDVLLEKGYPALLGVSDDDLTARLERLRPLVPVGARAAAGRIPYVLVVDVPRTAESFQRVDLRGRAGFTTMEDDDLARFRPLEGMGVPGDGVYLMTDVDTGAAYLDVPPDEALPRIHAAERSPLTLAEGIALVTALPDLLLDGNRFSMLGSRCGDRRVTAIWVSERRPRLGWCWAGAPHTWLGSASCRARLG